MKYSALFGTTNFFRCFLTFLHVYSPFISTKCPISKRIIDIDIFSGSFCYKYGDAMVNSKEVRFKLFEFASIFNRPARVHLHRKIQTFFIRKLRTDYPASFRAEISHIPTIFPLVFLGEWMLSRGP